MSEKGDKAEWEKKFRADIKSTVYVIVFFLGVFLFLAVIAIISSDEQALAWGILPLSCAGIGLFGLLVSLSDRFALSRSLKKLAKLKEKETISDEEFEKKKKAAIDVFTKENIP